MSQKGEKKKKKYSYFKRIWSGIEHNETKILAVLTLLLIIITYSQIKSTYQIKETEEIIAKQRIANEISSNIALAQDLENELLANNRILINMINKLPSQKEGDDLLIDSLEITKHEEAIAKVGFGSRYLKNKIFEHKKMLEKIKLQWGVAKSNLPGSEGRNISIDRAVEGAHFIEGGGKFQEYSMIPLQELILRLREYKFEMEDRYQNITSCLQDSFNKETC